MDKNRKFRDNLIKRTKEFAHRCLKLCSTLPDNWIGKHIRGQLFRCSTSVAANYRAACFSQSKKSFLSKLGIVVEEIDESCFWIEFIVEEKLLTENKCKPLLIEGEELKAIFITSQKITRRNIKNLK